MFAASFPAPVRPGPRHALRSSPISLESNLFANPSGATNPDAQSQAFHTHQWTPLGQALSRFHDGVHRFDCERRMELLSKSIERLRSFLQAGAPGTGTDALFSSSFRGVSVVPAGVKIVRQDSSFKVHKMDWKTAMAPEQKLGPEEFSTRLSEFLTDYSPLALAQLDCLEISEVVAAPSSSRQSKIFRSRIRFELANTSSAGAVSRSGITSPLTAIRRQAVGEWEIDWQEEGSGGANQTLEAGE